MLEYVVMPKPYVDLPDSCRPLKPEQIPTEPEELFKALEGLAEGTPLESGQQHAAYQFTLALAEIELPAEEREIAHRLIGEVYRQLLDLGTGGRKDNSLAYRRAYGRAMIRRDRQPRGRRSVEYFDEVIGTAVPSR